MKRSPIVLIAVAVALVCIMRSKPQKRFITDIDTHTEFGDELTPFISDGINAQSQMGRLIRELLQ
ncbi:hypothetical protein [Bacillus sp. JCM 19041]|uniref:hypothetical protein n=1 Tax=Bacillus sp. JCM 19041 TaxID=1460637 RepID=UPI0006D2C1CE